MLYSQAEVIFPTNICNVVALNGPRSTQPFPTKDIIDVGSLLSASTTVQSAAIGDMTVHSYMSSTIITEAMYCEFTTSPPPPHLPPITNAYSPEYSKI